MKNPIFQDTSPDRVDRGGSWYHVAGGTRVSGRYWFDASFRNNFRGFRIFRSTERS